MYWAAVSHSLLPMSQNHRMRRIKIYVGYGSRPRIKGYLPVLLLLAESHCGAGQIPETQTTQGFRVDLWQCDPLWATRVAHLSQKRSPSLPIILTGSHLTHLSMGTNVIMNFGRGNTLKPNCSHVSLELEEYRRNWGEVLRYCCNFPPDLKLLGNKTLF